jgi:hypothetical protein
MKQLVLLTFFVSFMAHAESRACKVYGISDSPQKLTCSFKNQEIALRCKDGQYYLNSTKVLSAFHFEVEEGPVPLVFKAHDIQLTVTIDSKVDIQGELEKGGKTHSGSCF